MKRTSDTLEVAHVPGLEPEEQPARRVIGSEAEVAIGSAPANARATPLRLPVRITDEMSVAEATAALGTRCALCRHWRRDEWSRLRRVWSDPSNHVGAQLLNTMRGQLLGLDLAQLPELSALDNGPESPDVEHALASLGICTALTEIIGEAIVTAAESACPKEEGPKGEDLSKCFKPRMRSDDTRRAFSTLYDSIMKIASGRR